MESSAEMSFLSALLPLAGIVFIIAAGVVLLNQHFHKNLYRQKLAREELKNVHQRELLRSSIEVQEEERRRIALDLHDELGATLSIARMQLLQLERMNTEKDETPVVAVKEIRSSIDTALASMRRISHALMPPQLASFGLIETLQAVAAQVNKTGAIDLQISVSSDIARLPSPVELGLYRINMELISNSLKHAGATQINIHLHQDAGFIVCIYHDNGKGMVDNKATGLGLKSMEARVSSLMGTLDLKDTGRNGFSASLKIPIPVEGEQKFQ